MQRTLRTLKEELEFVRKYCLGRTFPADSERCPYAKTKMHGSYEYKTATGDTNISEPEAMYLCRYPDRQMPTSRAALIRELEECPHTERREIIDASDAIEV
jgi:hypothetical protein